MNTNPDHTIDKVLTGLRNTPPLIGLEARVHQRLAAQAPHVSTPRTWFHVQPRFAFAAALSLLVLASLATLNRHRQTQLPQALSTGFDASSEPFRYGGRTDSVISTGAKQFHRLAQRKDPCILSAKITPCVPEQDRPKPNPDPDAIALAETLAPSHPAPPLPLSPQEALLMQSTRQGQPIEIAELDSARGSILHALPAARERTVIDQYVHALLGPLAAAEAIRPTPSITDEPAPSPAVDPHSSK